MDEPPARFCQQVISNEGTSEKSRGERGTYRAMACGLEADTYCNDCAMYLCSVHHESRHNTHDTAQRLEEPHE